MAGPTGPAGTPALVLISQATAPTSPALGQEWFDTSQGVLYKRVTDGTDSAWLDLSSPPNAGADGVAGADGAGGVADFVASGVLPNGVPVNLKADGTIEAVSVSLTPVSETIPAWDGIGYVNTPAYFSAGRADYPDVAFDPTTEGRFVVAYKYVSGEAAAVVGTVSGDSITFGSEYTFSTATSVHTQVAFDPNTSGRFVVTYVENSNATAIVGNISGSSITFGSSSVYQTACGSNSSLAFDPFTTNRFVIVYQGLSDKGTAIVGTLSGTNTVSFGTAAIHNTGDTYYNSIAFNPNTANQFIVGYQDEGNGDYGTVCIGTLNATSITFGVEIVFNSAVTKNITVSFDPYNANKFVLVIVDGSDSNIGKAIIGTISGASISFGALYNFSTASATYAFGGFVPNTENKIACIFRDANNSSYGTVVVGTVSGTSISFGSEYVVYSNYHYFNSRF